VNNSQTMEEIQDPIFRNLDVCCNLLMINILIAGLARLGLTVQRNLCHLGASSNTISSKSYNGIAFCIPLSKTTRLRIS
jgi:hypothetical protein